MPFSPSRSIFIWAQMIQKKYLIATGAEFKIFFLKNQKIKKEKQDFGRWNLKKGNNRNFLGFLYWSFGCPAYLENQKIGTSGNGNTFRFSKYYNNKPMEINVSDSRYLGNKKSEMLTLCIMRYMQCLKYCYWWKY